MSAVTIKLKYPIEVSGAKVAEVRMRRPTVNDMLAGEKMGGSDAEKEVAIFGNLSDMSPADIRKLDLADYKKLQEAWKGFLD